MRYLVSGTASLRRTVLRESVATGSNQRCGPSVLAQEFLFGRVKECKVTGERDFIDRRYLSRMVTRLVDGIA